MNLLVFNIRVDADHPTQAITTRWLSVLSEHFEKILVITMHQGRLVLPPNVVVHALTITGTEVKLRKTIRFFRVLLQLLRTETIGACFVHQAIVPGAMAGPVLKLMRIPTVLWYTHAQKSLMLRVCHWFADRVITCSRETFPIRSSRLIATGHGIDTEFFSPFPGKRDDKPGRTFLIISISRFAPVKRIEVLLRAVQLLRKGRQDEFVVHLYGLTQTEKEENYLRDLRSQVVHLGLAEHVVWKGRVSNWDVPSIVRSADIFVSQQERGGVDKAVLEAMSCGIPVLLSNTSFVSILPERYREKLLFSPGSAEEMAEKLHCLMRIPQEERNEVGRILRKIVVQKHSVTALARNVRCIMSELAERSRRL